jgi:hypothetical protein
MPFRIGRRHKNCLKDAERRISKLRREFREQFDSTVVAHASGADQGDPHASRNW